ncbi:MAG: c-type cytochrome [Magnetococcales bacterium]|nr:c-type cytochrome [Magnetococcales bacterium]
MVVSVSFTLISTSDAYAKFNARSAMKVLKRNDCTKCHSVKKSKNGPSYRKVSKKYRGKPDAEEKLYKHLTTNPIVELEDGTKEEHKKTDFDSDEQLREFIRWILTL